MPSTTKCTYSVLLCAYVLLSPLPSSSSPTLSLCLSISLSLSLSPYHPLPSFPYVCYSSRKFSLPMKFCQIQRRESDMITLVWQESLKMLDQVSLVHVTITKDISNFLDNYCFLSIWVGGINFYYWVYGLPVVCCCVHLVNNLASTLGFLSYVEREPGTHCLRMRQNFRKTLRKFLSPYW